MRHGVLWLPLQPRLRDDYDDNDYYWYYWCLKDHSRLGLDPPRFLKEPPGIVIAEIFLQTENHSWHPTNHVKAWEGYMVQQQYNKLAQKVLKYGTTCNEKSAQRRRKHCALAAVRQSQKFSPRRKPPSRGWRWPKFNQLEMVTTFTYEPSLARIDACNFKLSW